MTESWTDLEDNSTKLPNLTLGTITLVESNDEDAADLLAAITRRCGSINPTGTVTAGSISVYSEEEFDAIA